MNGFERYVYNLVRNNPALKKRIRNSYQKVCDLIPPSPCKSAYPIVNRPGCFFGFHDHTPFSADNTRLLACRASIPLRMPLAGETLSLGYFDGDTFEDFHPVAETRAWMWHTGCKLQWKGDSRKIVFNDHVDGKNISRIVDTETGDNRDLSDSIATISPDGRWGIGYSFARVQKYMPGYGYLYETHEKSLDEKRPADSGIQLLDLETGKNLLLRSIQDIAEIAPEDSMTHAWHFVTHAVFSPNSKRFIFLHRWVGEDVENRKSRMLSMDIRGEDIHVFPTTGMVSHIGWKDSEHVVAYCRVHTFDDQYVLFSDKEPEKMKILGLGCFRSDGHPSFDPSERWMVTDMYPDRRRLQTLILYDMFKECRYDLARLYMPPPFQTPSPDKHWACDLHPRWDRKSRYLCFDATFTGERSLCTIDLGPAFLEEEKEPMSLAIYTSSNRS